MRQYLISFLFWFVCIPFSHAQKPVTKRALLIGIGNYPKEGGWTTISSLRDIGFVKTALEKQDFKDIRMIRDAEASKKGIIDALEKLINDVPQNSGDVVFIHISSHGEQLDDILEKDEVDMRDESIVTYYAISPDLYYNDPSRYDLRKIQSEYLTDDEFGALVNRLRMKLGKQGDVIITVDACHSGTVVRGMTVRGGRRPLLSSATGNSGLTDTEGVFKDRVSTQVDESSMATYVLISAARAEQPNTETYGDDHRAMGSLTYALTKSLAVLDSSATYRSLFAKIQSVMRNKVPGQNPVIEGSGIDRSFLGGRFVFQKPYFTIASINDNQITVNGGLFAGLGIGAKVAVYKAPTVDPKHSTPLSSGVVLTATNYTAEIKLDKALEIDNETDGWVFISSPAFMIEPVQIGFDTKNASLKFSADEIKNIKESLKETNASFAGTPELYIVKGNRWDSVVIASNGYLYRAIENIAANPAKLKDAVEKYVQYKFIQEFNAKDERVQLDIQLVPRTNRLPDLTRIDSIRRNGVYEVYEGDTIYLRVKNNGANNVYINLLDLQPDGIINCLMPSYKKSIIPEELVIRPGETRLFDKYKIGISKPYGTELFKIFGSVKPIDMENLATPQGETRGNLTVLEKIVKQSNKIGRRGGDVKVDNNADGSTYDLVFEIKKR